MRYTLLALALLATPALAVEPYVAVSHGFRAESYGVAVGADIIKLDNGSFGVEGAFTSMGRQPAGYHNINRMAEVNLVAHVKFSERVYGFAKVGANNTAWSHNGTNSYDRSGDSLWGWHVGAGLEMPLPFTDNLMLQAGMTTYEYVQVNNPNKGGFSHQYVGLRYLF